MLNWRNLQIPRNVLRIYIAARKGSAEALPCAWLEGWVSTSTYMGVQLGNLYIYEQVEVVGPLQNNRLHLHGILGASKSGSLYHLSLRRDIPGRSWNGN